MNFFCTKKHYDQYVQKMHLEARPILGLNLQEALGAARMLFSETQEE